MNTKSQAYLAEMVGTFALVFFGTLSITVFAAVLGADAGATALGYSLAFGLTLVLLVYAMGHLSGAHFNPAVTAAMVATKRMSVGDGATYVIAQLAGAAVAALLHMWILPDAGAQTNFGLTVPGDAIGNSATVAVVVEAILTFFLVWVIFATAVSGKAPAGFHGLAIGMTLLAANLAGGALTGASLNPARTFGPAVASGVWTDHWVYWVGPVVGGLLAAWLYTYAFMRPEERPARAPSNETSRA